MKTSYLLPCTCGERYQVDSSESGLVMKCRCGASLQVPTLRGLAQLEKVVLDEPAPRQQSWGGAQRGMAIGVVLVVVGLAAGIYCTARPLPRPQDVFEPMQLVRLGIFEDADARPSSPAEAMALWRLVEDQGLYAAPPKEVEKYQRARRVVVWWRAVAYTATGVGIVVLGAFFLVDRRGRSRRTRPQPIASVAQQ
jgi:hypothetical protein